MLHLITPAIIAALCLALEYKTAVYILAGVTAAMAAGEAVRLAVPAINRRFIARLGPFMKPVEERTPTAATYLLLASLAVLLLFGSTIAALAVLFLGLGDPAAGVIGSRYGRLRMPSIGGRGGGKSAEGALAFFAAALAGAAALWAGGLYSVFWPGAAGAAVAALVEILPVPLEDNLTVPLASAAVMWALWVV